MKNCSKSAMIFLLLNLEQFIIQVLNAVELLDVNLKKRILHTRNENDGTIGIFQNKRSTRNNHFNFWTHYNILVKIIWDQTRWRFRMSFFFNTYSIKIFIRSRWQAVISNYMMIYMGGTKSTRIKMGDISTFFGKIRKNNSKDLIVIESCKHIFI